MARTARSSSQDSAYSGEDGVEAGEGVWDHLDDVEEDEELRTSQDQQGEGQQRGQKKRLKMQEAPDPIKTTNFNDLPLPPSAVQAFHEHAATKWVQGIVAIGTVVAILSHFQLHPGFVVGAIAIGAFVTRRTVENLKEDFAWDTERKRGTQKRNAAEAPLESAEWLNTVVSAVWPILDPELFVAGVDLLEDALKAQSPSIVRTVRVSSVEQGTNPMRLLGMRQLPNDIEVAATHNRQNNGRTTRKKRPGSQKLDIKLEDDSASGSSTPVPLSSSDPVPAPDLPAEEPGTYINVEVEFAYRRLPPPAAKSSNAHFLLYMGVGVKKLMKFELPVWVELSGLHGKIRLRLQMIPEPPFVRHVKFSFPKLPAIEIVAKPLRTFNIMSLPGISPYILTSINSVISNFTAPKSYTIDLSRFFLGSDVAMKTESIGIVCLVIHRAEGLASADVDGSSDPFVNVSFSQIGRILYTSRIMSDSLNPVWEEVAFLRIASEHIDDNDSVRLTVLDHDRFSRNDVLGFIDLPVSALYSQPGRYVKATQSLRSSHRGTRAQGTLSYSAAFFTLAKSTPPISSAAAEDADGVQSERPSSKGSKHKPMFTDRSQAEDSRSGAYAQRMREMLDGRLPANTSQRSGIVAFQVHQISQLDCPRGQHLQGNAHHKEGHLPSSYCTVFFNDEKIFQTRTKPFSAAPYFNASSELFCRDWTRSRLDVAVMDARDRDHDVVIGIVSLTLRDLFLSRSQITEWYPLTGGSGHGRIRLSVLFKPVDIEIHPCLRDWSVGVVEVSSAKATDLKDSVPGRLRMKVDQGTSYHTKDSDSVSEGDGKSVLDWSMETPIRIPVLARHCSALFLRLQTPHNLSRHSTVGETYFWLSVLSDGVAKDITALLHRSLTSRDTSRPPGTIPLPNVPQGLIRPTKGVKADRESYEGDVQRVMLEPEALQKQSLSESTPEREPVLHLQVRWVPGFQEEHRDIILDSSAACRQAYQVWLHRSDRPHDSAKHVLFKPPLDADKDNEDGQQGVAVSPKSSAAPSQQQSRANSRRGSLGETSDQELDGWTTDEDGDRPLKKPTSKGMKTMKWVAHGLKVATKKVRSSTKHKVTGPTHETELYSSF